MKTGFTVVMTIGCILCAVYCNLPQKPRLMLTIEQQKILVSRGHEIAMDGRGGRKTDAALLIEVQKRGN
jgi:hypothetical protein